MEKTTKSLTIFSEWVMNLFLLHIYWIGGTLFAGVIFGIVPATIALFATIRKLFANTESISVFDTFKKEYKVNFKSSIFIGLLYVVIGVMIYSYVLFIHATRSSLLAYTHIILYLFLFLGIIFSLYLIPVFIHFEMDVKNLIPNTFRILLTNMKWNFPMLITVIGVLLIYSQFSVSLFFFGVSLPAFVISFFCRQAFQDFQDKQQKLNS